MKEMFTKLADFLEEGSDINICIRKRSSDSMVASVSFRNNDLNDSAKNFIQPFVLSGTPAELDEGFISAITEPLTKSKGLQTSMKDFEAAQAVAAANSKAEADKKKNEADKEKKRKDSLKKLTDKADELKKDKKFGEAAKAYKEAIAIANDAEKKGLEKKLAECKQKDLPDMFGWDEEESDNNQTEEEAPAEETEEPEPEEQTEEQGETEDEETEETEPAEDETDMDW